MTRFSICICICVCICICICVCVYGCIRGCHIRGCDIRVNCGMEVQTTSRRARGTRVDRDLSCVAAPVLVNTLEGGV